MNTDFLNKDTGVSVGLLIKVVCGIILMVGVCVPVYTQMMIFGSRQQERIDADIIPNVAELMHKDKANDKRLDKIEIQTIDYAENKIIFKQMAQNIEDIKKVLIK